ncbi:lactadherin-like [Montipora capricornis]|uniref:lactadherin-like n=1 Tax=Montipora capricornis TaxID=246305 RepID=UPI0035F11F03
MPLGVEDKRITDGLLTASTYYNSGYAPWYGRLNSIYSWGVRSNRHGEWFQVNFVETRVVKGVATQGRQNGNYWVKSYTIGYSVDEMNFALYRQGSAVKVFDGNSDRHTIVYHQFIKPFTAVNVRIYPKTWYGWICLRAEFYGCAASLCNAPLGVSNKRIPDSRITASSELNQFNAKHARLGQIKKGSNMGAWCSRDNNKYQWLKVDFGRLMKVTQIVTQGRYDYGYWVTSFYLSSSVDNVHWSMYRFMSGNKLFQANRDQNSLLQNAITPAIYARYVKLNPRGWYRRICMRIEYYGCVADRCDVPLGLQDGRVLRSMFTATSLYNYYYGPWSARLQAQNQGQTRGGWVAKYNNANQWWQVDLGVTSRVKRIATQARYDANHWVKTYTLSYSNDGARFNPYKYGKRIKVFQGNYERYLVNYHRLNPTIKARYIRVHPKTWYGYIAMRVELYGCRLGVLCNRPMGMQTGRIKNNMITASSFKDRYHSPWLARLQRKRSGRYAGTWMAKYNNYYQWLEVDFGKASKIIKIATQGRQDAPMWVTQYYVTRSLDALRFKQYEERNSLKV